MRKKKMENIIIFENGIAHPLTESELAVLMKAVADYEPKNQFDVDAKKSLCSLFLDHLD